MNPPSVRQRRYLLIAQAGISICLLGYLFSTVDIGRAGATALNAVPLLMLAGTLQNGAHLFLTALRWKMVARALGGDLPFPAALHIVWIGAFFSQVLPGSVGGDVVRMWLYWLRCASRRLAIHSVALERLAMVMVLLLLVLAIQPGLAARGAPISIVISAVVVLSVLIAGLAVLLRSSRLLLPREAANDSMHDVVSVLLAYPGLRSVGLHWDSRSLADDLTLLQSKRDRSDPATAALHEEIGSRGSAQSAEFLRSEHGEFALPVAASRDAQTLLKRQAGAALVVCLNFPAERRVLADAVAGDWPHVRFFNFYSASPESAGAANNQSFFAWGFTLHERMALVQAADAYAGTFDELGCTAVIAGRPAILLDGGSGVRLDAANRSDGAVWLPSGMDQPELTRRILQFLSDRLASRTQ